MVHEVNKGEQEALGLSEEIVGLHRAWKLATKSEWDEMDVAVTSGDILKIDMAGRKLNSALLKYRQQNPQKFV
jgi:hypothetical protein